MAYTLFELPSRTLVSGEKTLKISRPILMGILNTTPDSFSEGPSFFEFDDALAQPEKLLLKVLTGLISVVSLLAQAVCMFHWMKNYGG